MKYTFLNTKAEGFTYVLSLQYVKGALKSVEFDFPSIPKSSYDRLMQSIHPLNIQSTIDSLQKLNFFIANNEAVTAKKEFNPVAAWCAAYKEEYHTEYSCTPKEADSLYKVLKKPEQVGLIKVFFQLKEWWAGTKTVDTFCKYFNEVKRLAVAENTPKQQEVSKPKHPDYYDKSYAGTLNPQHLQEYWQHLRGLGWKFDNGKWVQTQNNQ